MTFSRFGESGFGESGSHDSGASQEVRIQL